jgi:putative heme-binding domain-containing protein
VIRTFAALSITLAFTAVCLAQGKQIREPLATDPATIKVAKDFKVELLYSVPKDREGSWVNMCADQKGRLIVSDQYGWLYRVTPPALGGNPQDTKVERIPAQIGEAQGLLWAFNSLYVVVNHGRRFQSGLYRVYSSRDDDQLDSVKLLRPIQGGGEHGPHAVLLHPDGKRLAVICGDGTSLTQFNKSDVPTCWGEDHLLPRMPDGRGFMAGVLGPGGAIYFTDPEGKNWELFSVGFRNEFDAAFNKQGDLFTYDADMEWDFNTPWYRPTRVCLVTSGSEFGWRNGAGKWPPHYADSLPAIYNVGPGSPTGMTFGYGAKFPHKYQNALFMCDWSYGKIYAMHLKPEGSGYRGELEEFAIGTPLPLTDVVVNSVDGALYFTIGGRVTKSGLYRITYTGTDPTDPAKDDDANADQRAIRRKLEAFHGRQDPAAVGTAWPYLANADRFIRYAARVAIEHQPTVEWMSKALAETEPATAIAALLALVRVTGQDPAHHPGRQVDASLRARILESLGRIDWDKLTDTLRLDLLRVYAVLFSRMGPPTVAEQVAVTNKFSPKFPSNNRLINGDLCMLLVYLQAQDVAAKAMKLLKDAPTQEEQIEYAKSLRMLRAGWTMDLRREYFEWFRRARTFKGGMSIVGFMDNIKRDAISSLTPQEREALQNIISAPPVDMSRVNFKSRPTVKNYTLDDLAPVLEKGLTNRDFDRGRRLFGEASCFACHRYDNEGGAQGPDLSSVAGRFSQRDLLEKILNPNKAISDQYAAVDIETIDGKQFHGRVVNHNGDTVTICPNMLDPGSTIGIDRKRIESMTQSKVSLMPTGLLNSLTEDEIKDLMAYLLSRGDRNSPIFKK